MKNYLSPKTIICIILIVVLSFIYFLSRNNIDSKVNDYFIKLFARIETVKASDDVVLVVVDDKSVDKINWPWKRDLFADIFEYLENYSNAKAVVFQNIIVYPDTYNPDNDKIFYTKIKNLKKLISSFILFNSDLAGDILPSEFVKVFESKSAVNIIDKRKHKLPSSYRGVIKLPKDYILNVKNLASAILSEDKDTVIRSYMPVVELNGKLYPSLALSAYSMYSGINDFVLYDDFLCSADSCKSLKIPVFEKKSKDYLDNTVNGVFSLIKWYSPIDKYYSHKTYSAIDLLVSYYAIKSGNIPKINPDEFKDKIVVIGLNADKNVWEQLSETPVLKKQADIDIHATFIDNMINGKFVSINNSDFTFVISLIFSIFVIFGFKSLKNNLIFTLLLSIVYFIYYIFEYSANIYVPPLTPIITMFSCAFIKKLYLIITTDKTSEMIKHAMGKYVSKDVMKKVLLNLDKLNPGGKRAVVTILFVDIRNFTQIAENLNPSDVTSILNEYFSTIEPIIAKYHGIINKYMGDGVLAIFGEPITNENHALEAIMCAFEIISNVKQLREKLLAEGKPKIEIGIGINSGEVFAGNIGTEERLEYTVIGDNVNLAYRIEAFNQILKTQFLISEYTYSYVKDSIEVVKLSKVNIKGKSKPIDIYEVLKIRQYEK